VAKRIVVVGASGQDGRLLTERLNLEGHQVFGVERTRLTSTRPLADRLPPSLDISNAEATRAVLTTIQPDEIYYLAAFHHSSEELDEDVPTLLARSQAVHVTGLVNVLETVRRSTPACRTFYAASSHVFGTPEATVQNERTPFEPRTMYSITKTAGIHASRFYRERYGVHVSVGILYNHESRYRAAKFLSQKVVQGARAAVAAKRAGRVTKLALGDLTAVVDWGYAPDYMDAAIRMLTRDKSDDFVVATGVPHTVADFAQIAFAHLGLDWREHVEQASGIVRRQGATLIGDSTKLRSATGWHPSVSFEEMIGLLLRNDEVEG
jgi:GDPmannose 4,6-dehydratase